MRIIGRKQMEAPVPNPVAELESVQAERDALRRGLGRIFTVDDKIRTGPQTAEQKLTQYMREVYTLRGELEELVYAQPQGSVVEQAADTVEAPQASQGGQPLLVLARRALQAVGVDLG